MLKSWEAATSRAKRKSGIAPEELFLLGSPSAYRLARLGLPWKGDSELFSYWGTYHVKEVQKRKFLVVERNGKPKVLSVIRHYRLSSYGSGRGKGEENAMTLLHENPSKTNTVPPQGCPVGGSSAGWPKLLDEEGVRTFAGNCQSRMTPIGKNGLPTLPDRAHPGRVDPPGGADAEETCGSRPQNNTRRGKGPAEESLRRPEIDRGMRDGRFRDGARSHRGRDPLQRRPRCGRIPAQHLGRTTDGFDFAGTGLRAEPQDVGGFHLDRRSKVHGRGKPERVHGRVERTNRLILSCCYKHRSFKKE